MRYIGRFLVMLAGIVSIQYSDALPWWATIIAIVAGCFAIQIAYRDQLRSEGVLS